MLTKLIAKIQSYVQCEEGATAIEYGLIAAGISLVIVASVFLFGDQLEITFDAMTAKMTEAAERAAE